MKEEEKNENEMINLVDWFKELMLNAHIFNDGFNHQIRFANHTSQIRWSI